MEKTIWTRFVIEIKHDPNSGAALEQFQETQTQWLQDRIEELVKLTNGKYSLEIKLIEQTDEPINR